VSHWVTPAIIAGLILLAVLVRLRVGPSQRLDDSPGATIARAIQDTARHGDGVEIVVGRDTVHYWQGDLGFRLDAVWDAPPGVVYVPSPETWSACVPSWMQTRRDEIVERLGADTGRDVVDSTSYGPDQVETRTEHRQLAD
jgi:hypothetical protein